MAETRSDAYKAFDSTVKRFGDKYPGARKCLVKDKEKMLAFYDFPAVHWQHIRTSNPIESTFSTVRLAKVMENFNLSMEFNRKIEPDIP